MKKSTIIRACKLLNSKSQDEMQFSPDRYGEDPILTIFADCLEQISDDLENDDAQTFYAKYHSEEDISPLIEIIENNPPEKAAEIIEDIFKKPEINKEEVARFICEQSGGSWYETEDKSINEGLNMLWYNMAKIFIKFYNEEL